MRLILLTELISIKNYHIFLLLTNFSQTVTVAFINTPDILIGTLSTITKPIEKISFKSDISYGRSVL